MKLFSFIILILALAIPVSASSVVSWTQKDIPGYNLTLNYTSEFNVAKDDILGISIKNIGNKSENDTITIYKIQVKGSSEADGIWTGSVTIEPNSNYTINFELNVTTDFEETVNIKIYYHVNSETNTINIKAYYPGASDAPEIKSWSNNKKDMILAWSPQVVDYIYVNDTISETIEYSITTVKPMTTVKWSKDGLSVEGDSTDNSYTYTKNWTNNDLGFHTIIFKGSNADTNVEFRWYVNVYEIDNYKGGSLFDVIDDALDNHATDIKVRMFKSKIAKNGYKSNVVTQKVNQLHDEISMRQMTREALRKEFKRGNITIQTYTAALKESQFDAKLAQEVAKIAKEELKDEESWKKFEKLSEIDNNWNMKKKNIDTKIKSKGLKKTRGKSENDHNRNEKSPRND